MAEAKQTNFRLNPTTVDRFRDFCKQEKMTEEQGFDFIMEVLKTEQAKNAVPDRKTEIETFEAHAKALMNAFLQSLEIAKSTEMRVKDQLADTIAEKDNEISSLKKELSNAKQDLQSLEEKVAATEAERTRAVQTAVDKEALNVQLSKRVEELEKEISDQDILSKLAALVQNIGEKQEKQIQNKET